MVERLEALAEVARVTFNLERAEARVTLGSGQAFSEARVKQAIESAGFTLRGWREAGDDLLTPGD